MKKLSSLDTPQSAYIKEFTLTWRAAWMLMRRRRFFVAVDAQVKEGTEVNVSIKIK